jgi:SAM-dependent methyltransferase
MLGHPQAEHAPMSAIPEKPKPFMEGMIPTLNHRGFMSETLDRFSMAFIDYAAICDAEALDMGCAYGVATREVLERGGRVLACDMEPGHLDILVRETPAELRGRLRTAVGELPDAEFPPQSFGAILCSRVIHFLRGPEVRESIRRMGDWLRPGGRLFLIADTPYTGFWFSTAAAYERRKAAGEEWPGFIADVAPLLKMQAVPDGMLNYLNPLDPDILRRECEALGLIIEEAGFTGRGGDRDGRNHAGVIARRP